MHAAASSSGSHGTRPTTAAASCRRQRPGPAPVTGSRPGPHRSDPTPSVRFRRRAHSTGPGGRGGPPTGARRRQLCLRHRARSTGARRRDAPPPLPRQPSASPAGGPGRREEEGGGAPAQWGRRPNIHSVLQVVRHPRRFPQPPAMLFTASFSGPPAARGPTAVRGPRQSGDSATRQSTRPRRPPATASASLLRRPGSRQSGGPGTTPPRPDLGTLVTAGLSG